MNNYLLDSSVLVLSLKQDTAIRKRISRGLRVLILNSGKYIDT